MRALTCWLWCYLHNPTLVEWVRDFFQLRAVPSSIEATNRSLMWNTCLRLITEEWERLQAEHAPKAAAPPSTATAPSTCAAPEGLVKFGMETADGGVVVGYATVEPLRAERHSQTPVRDKQVQAQLDYSYGQGQLDFHGGMPVVACTILDTPMRAAWQWGWKHAQMATQLAAALNAEAAATISAASVEEIEHAQYVRMQQSYGRGERDFRMGRQDMPLDVPAASREAWQWGFTHARLALVLNETDARLKDQSLRLRDAAQHERLRTTYFCALTDVLKSADAARDRMIAARAHTVDAVPPLHFAATMCILDGADWENVYNALTDIVHLVRGAQKDIVHLVKGAQNQHPAP